MHELSLAVELVRAAEEAARRADANRVTAVAVTVGALSGVAEDALRFAFDVAAAGTLLAGARLDVRPVPVTVRCPRCGDVPLPGVQLFRCPVCDTPTADVRAGRELELESIEVE
ncbi:MAG: hydrogenase maturation nickel metallochaperone HypA [Gemmataceae bacterium]|uniref:Hydrogenase maturation factor HypA n=1 Tax=Urbifossiella limnaea TaxID=2528023 RepID=A0A517Y3D4_9BACT|nr:hydrogenase maturation nickel metallochaperone HypA [Urbifossiella limnaea]QDU24228.1 hydrogenase nickel incorporation protein [Urbifossiella limnaea]